MELLELEVIAKPLVNKMVDESANASFPLKDSQDAGVWTEGLVVSGNQSELYFFLNRTSFDDLSSNLVDSYFLDQTCVNSDQMDTFDQFVTCLVYFLKDSYLTSMLVLLFSVLTVLLNIVVICHINKLKQYKTVFDRIFIGHALTDGLVGMLVIPNYCVYTVFGYWPLGKLLCHFYVSLDYTTYWPVIC